MSERILGYVMARNEWPLLGLAITHALANVVDHVVVVDHASEDGTIFGLSYLEEIWPGRMTVVRLRQGEVFLQRATTRVVLSAVNALEYDWIYVFDADEFLLSPTGSNLKMLLSEIPQSAEIVRYEVLQWVAPVDMNDFEPDCYRKINRRAVPCLFSQPSGKILGDDVERGRLNYFDVPFQSKVIVRSSHASALLAGAHLAQSEGIDTEYSATIDQLFVGHLPLLSRRRLTEKCRQGERLMRSGLDPQHGWQAQMLRRIELAGGLDEFWAHHSIETDTTAASKITPITVTDDALACALSEAIDLFELTMWRPDPRRSTATQPAIDLDALVISVHSVMVEGDQIKAERDQIKAERDQIKAERDQIKAQLTALETSHIWRATGPYRHLRSLVSLSNFHLTMRKVDPQGIWRNVRRWLRLLKH
jgi:hypothetical protein